VADEERPAVGSVAEEAARLLDALGGWASSAQAAYADQPAPEANGTPIDGASERCQTCGAQDGAGRAASCSLCPVCQGIGLLRSVRPETVDRLAELVGALAGTLRDVASTLRTDARAAAGGHQSPPPDRQHGARVQDIRVDDDDQHTESPGSATS